MEVRPNTISCAFYTTGVGCVAEHLGLQYPTVRVRPKEGQVWELPYIWPQLATPELGELISQVLLGQQPYFCCYMSSRLISNTVATLVTASTSPCMKPRLHLPLFLSWWAMYKFVYDLIRDFPACVLASSNLLFEPLHPSKLSFAVYLFLDNCTLALFCLPLCRCIFDIVASKVVSRLVSIFRWRGRCGDGGVDLKGVQRPTPHMMPWSRNTSPINIKVYLHGGET